MLRKLPQQKEIGIRDGPCIFGGRLVHEPYLARDDPTDLLAFKLHAPATRVHDKS